MQKSKVIPMWLSIILMILCFGLIISTIYMALTTDSKEPTLTIISSLLFIASTIYAIIYCSKGYKKEGSKYYKGFTLLFTITEFFTILGFLAITIEMKTNFTLEDLMVDNYMWFIFFSIIMFVCMFPITLAKDLKRRHAMIIVSIHFVCALAAMLLSFGENVAILSNNYIKNMLLTIILDIMIYAKYKDKVIRNRTAYK